MTLPQQIQTTIGTPATTRTGMVTGTSPLTVEVQGVAFANVGIVGWYVPVVGDVVVLLGQSAQTGTQGASWCILGDLSPVGQSGDNWTDYTPVLTSSGGAVNLGSDGVLLGRWQQLRGKTIATEVVLEWGATSTSAVGQWFFTAPFTGSDRSRRAATGACQVFDNGTAVRAAIVNLSTPPTTFFVTVAPTTVLGQGSPQTFAVGDAVRFSIIYERV